MRDETPYFEERQSDESRRRDTKQKEKHDQAVKRILTFDNAQVRSQDSHSPGQEHILNPEGAAMREIHSNREISILQQSFRRGSSSRLSQMKNSDHDRNEEL